MLDWAAYSFGAVGSLVLGFAYYRLERGFYTDTMGRYYLHNALGSSCLVCSLAVHFNLGAMIIECFWAAISIRGYISHRWPRAF